MKYTHHFRAALAIVFCSMFFPFCSTNKGLDNQVSFGIIADVHQDLQKNARERLQIFVDSANQLNLDFIVQLGDLSHGTTTDSILQVWNKYEGIKYHVLGNHDTDNLTKEAIVKKQEMRAGYYSYDCKGLHFVVLDLNYLIDEEGNYKDFGLGNNYGIASENKNLISPEQLKWLDEDLKTTNKPTILFAHQGMGTIWDEFVSPSAPQIRAVLEKHNEGNTKKVIACFAGDQHVDAYEEINGIHYFQINSASYYWADEAAIYSNGNMAEYATSLFAFATVNLNNRTLTLRGKESHFLEPVPTAKNYSQMEKIASRISSREVKF